MKLTIKNLSKKYGNHLVLDNINLEVEKGHIYALLGKNGAGKTTFFECLDNTIEYEGNFFINDNKDATDSIGFLKTENTLPEFLTGKEFLKFFLECNNLDIEKMEEYFQMIHFSQEDQHKFIKEYSLGMKNKLELLLYLILQPKVLLLDEPLTSFDIIAAKEMKDILKKLKKEHIIIISTHILELAKSICDELLLLKDGKLTKLNSKILKDKKLEDKIVELLEQ